MVGWESSGTKGGEWRSGRLCRRALWSLGRHKSLPSILLFENWKLHQTRFSAALHSLAGQTCSEREVRKAYLGAKIETLHSSPALMHGPQVIRRVLNALSNFWLCLAKSPTNINAAHEIHIKLRSRQI